MKLRKDVILFVMLISLCFWACGPEGEDPKLRKKAIADSIRKARDDAFNKASEENLKRSMADSIDAVNEFNAQLLKYDSLREADSLKVKRKKSRRGINPAPKRELGGRSPVK